MDDDKLIAFLLREKEIEREVELRAKGGLRPRPIKIFPPTRPSPLIVRMLRILSDRF